MIEVGLAVRLVERVERRVHVLWLLEETEGLVVVRLLKRAPLPIGGDHTPLLELGDLVLGKRPPLRQAQAEPAARSVAADDCVVLERPQTHDNERDRSGEQEAPSPLDERRQRECYGDEPERMERGARQHDERHEREEEGEHGPALALEKKSERDRGGEQQERYRQGIEEPVAINRKIWCEREGQTNGAGNRISDPEPAHEPRRPEKNGERHRAEEKGEDRRIRLWERLYDDSEK